MQVVSDSTGYAIAALTCLGGTGTPVRQVKEIAACTGAPAPYLSKLVWKLVDAGLLESKRGYKGGVQLARPAEKITMLDVARAIEGDKETDRCMLGLEACSDHRACPAHAFWKATRENIRSTMRQTTLAEVVRFDQERAARCSPRKKPAQPRKKKSAV